MTGGDNEQSTYLNVYYLIQNYRQFAYTYPQYNFNEIIGRKDIAQYNLRSKTLTKVNFRFCSVKRNIEKDETSKYAQTKQNTSIYTM